MQRYAYENAREVERLLNRAREMGSRGDHKRSKEYFLRARTLCRTAGVRHGLVSYALAVASDNLEEFADAVLYIVEAYEDDPSAPPILDSYDIIVGHIRSKIAWLVATELASPKIAEFYQLLLNEGAADEEAHVGMARHLVAVERHTDAADLLAAVTVLYPRSSSAWRLRAEVGRHNETPERVAEYEAELALLQPLAKAGLVGKTAQA